MASEAKIARPRARHRRSSPALWLSVLVAWGFCLGWFGPRLWSVIHSGLSAAQAISWLVFVGWIVVAWLFGLYYLALLLFSCSACGQTTDPLGRERPSNPAPVAILYTTCDDFSREAALSCVAQDHPNCHVFLLDDSNTPAGRAAVDHFHKEHPRSTTVIRRKGRQGFKAGNLNHALGIYGNRYPYFAICDADGILPSHFASRLLLHIEADRQIAFVQAMHRHNPNQQTPFARALGPWTDVYWRRSVRPRSRFGFLMFHGHGALLRTGVWRETGGFPEIVSEDLGFSTRAAQAGYRGVLASDVICYEDYPDSYARFCTRQSKYLRGTGEHVRRLLPAFLGSRGPGWVEKLDQTMGSLAMLLAAPFMVFLLNFAVVMPLLFARGRAGHDLVSPLATVATWDFYAVTMLSIFAPTLPFVVEMWRHPKELVRFLSDATTVHLSAVFRLCLEQIAFLLTGRAVFNNTGARAVGSSSRHAASVSQCAITLGQLGAALVLAVGAVLSANIGVLPVAIALAVGVLLQTRRPYAGALRWAVHIPACVLSTMVIWAAPSAHAMPAALVAAGLLVAY